MTQRLSTAYHPQTDGQTEKTNGSLEQYVRIYCDYQQDDWSHLLLLAEFTYNNSASATTKVSPFFANYGYHPTFKLKLVESSHVPAAESAVEKLRLIHENLQQSIRRAQTSQAKFFNRRVSPTPILTIGDKVWLIRRNIKTKRPSLKFDVKRMGPFPILHITPSGNAVTLQLPPQFHIHPTFHVSLIEPYHPNTIPGRMQAVPPPVEIDGALEYEVQEILDSRFQGRKLEYLVLWKGYSVDERTWEPASHVEECEALEEFLRRYPDKPGGANGPRSGPAGGGGTVRRGRKGVRNSEVKPTGMA
jgi:hypothetical protein